MIAIRFPVILRGVCVALSLLAVSAATAFGAEISEKDRAAAVFESQILAIDKAMGENFFGTILGYDVLLGYAPFNELSLHAKSNIDACVQFLGDPSHTDQQKRIAAHALHLAGIDEHVVFARKLIDLYDRRRISYWEFFEMLIPHHPFSEIAIDNFDDPQIRSLLTDVLRRADVQEREKTYIDNILSGDTWAKLREFEADCCSSSPPPKRPIPKPPREFMFFARLFKWEDYLSASDRRAWIVVTLQQNSQDGNSVVKGFLDTMLATGPEDYDDRDLETLWRIWNPSFRLTEPGSMRALLIAIRDEIAMTASFAPPSANPGP